MKKNNLLGMYIVFIVAIIFFWYLTSGDKTSSYTMEQFKKAMADKQITSITIQQNSQVPTGSAHITLKNSEEKYVLYLSDVNEFIKTLEKSDMNDYVLTDVPKDGWISQLIPILIAVGLVFLLFMVLFSGSIQGGGTSGSRMMSFTKSKAKLTNKEDISIRFQDVAGLYEEKAELEQVVDFLKSPGKYIKVGARIPKGLLMVGPPGTGKTLLAKAIAGEAGVPFFTISGSDFVEMFVGVGASRVRDLFDEAKKNAPCIVFIDEIDAVARRRGSGMGGGHDEREQTLNQMLVEMDGFKENEGIIVIAATNRVDILDPAIMRPGRFDRKVFVGKPDVRGREDILKVHSKNKPLSDDVDLEQVARTTAGFTGADLENLMNEAAILSARDDRKFITDKDVRQAFVKVGMGTEKKSRIISDKEKRITAVHEAGHAILFHVLPDVGPVYSVSIIPTGIGAAGYTMPLPDKDEMFNTKGQMLQDIIVTLGGRAAEEIKFDDITTGASSDIKKATEIARNMVTKYGFSTSVGLINYTGNEEEVFLGRDYGHVKNYGEAVATTIDKEVKGIIDSCYSKAKDLLKKYDGVLESCAELLLEKEKITRDEFEALFGEVGEGKDSL